MLVQKCGNKVRKMTLQEGIILALKVAFLCYVLEIVWCIYKRKNNSRRLELAKKNGWIVRANTVKSKIVNTAKKSDYENNYARLVYVNTYEYEIHGVRKRIKISSNCVIPASIDLYYDAEHRNKILNTENKNYGAVLVLFPIFVFVIVTGLVKVIYKV